jgi:hypothetical protein
VHCCIHLWVLGKSRGRPVLCSCQIRASDVELLNAFSLSAVQHSRHEYPG